MEKIIRNLKIEYSEFGIGDYIFLIHGWGSKKEFFQPVIDTLSLKFHVVAIDLPGFGGSQEPVEPINVDAFADIVSDFIASFGAADVMLLGHSFGGRIIIKLANRNDTPFSITKIVLVDSAGIMPKRTLGYKIRVKSYKVGKKILNAPVIRSIFPNAVSKMQNNSGSSDYQAASPIMRGCLVKAVNEDLTNLLPNISQDTLLIWGTLDDATPITDGELMERLMPNAGLAKINGAGHFSWIDNPSTFDAIIRSYFKI